MILVIDNYDSFTYNIVQYLGELGQELQVVRNDEISVKDIRTINPESIIISPGPCTPNEAGISLEVIKEYAPDIPTLGICLGHQAIAQAFGGKVVRADRLMHGKESNIIHDGKSIFNNIPSPFAAMRYHSLIVKPDTLPEEFEISAWTQENEIMGIRHKKFPVEGLQFHPESISTKHGKQLLENFIEQYKVMV